MAAHLRGVLDRKERAGADLADLEELYRRRFHTFAGGLLAVTSDIEAARDAVQEGFARAVLHRRRFRGDGSLEGWVWRIALNAAREARRKDIALDPLADTVAATVASASADERTFGMRAELRQLPERQRLAVFLHYYADLSYEDVADLLGVAPGTVAASLSAARSTLRKRYLEGYANGA